MTAPSFNSIYEVEFGFVWAIMRRAGIPDRDLEDLCHDVFVVVHRKLSDYDPSRPLRPWLFAIAWNTASHFRRRAPVRNESLRSVEVEAAPFTGRIEAADLLEKALLQVPEERRAVLLLHELEGVPIAEVAAALELNLNTVYSRLRTGRAELTSAVRRLSGVKEEAST